MRKIALLIVCLMPVFSFSQSSEFADTDYKNEIENWHQNRVKSLKSETGWLNIVGLYWLTEGENTFGCSKENTIIFPKGKADEQLGSFILKDGKVLDRGATIFSDETLSLVRIFKNKIGFVGSIGWYDYSFKDKNKPIPLSYYSSKQWPGVMAWNDSFYVHRLNCMVIYHSDFYSFFF